MSIAAAAIFRSALEGVKFLHSKNWLHLDLKPANIGVMGNPGRAVLLDIGHARQLEPGAVIRPTPDCGGTIGYLAPERELGNYDHLADIWSMGVILYELTHGHHPWKFALNPWRDREENKELRPTFLKSYQAATDRMKNDYGAARQSPPEGYIHRTSSPKAPRTLLDH